MTYDPNNIFAKILRGEIPAAKVLETDQAIAFLDIGPLNKGHLLLIPKAAVATLSDLPDDLASHLGSLLPRLCRAVRTATSADGVNVVVNHGEAAGQTVFHVHYHIIPRFQNDDVQWPWHHGQYEGDELEQMRSKIAEALGN